MYIHSSCLLFIKYKYLVLYIGNDHVIFLLNKYTAVKRMNKSLKKNYSRSNKIIRNWREY